MTAKLLVVGQAPSRTADRFEGRSGARLAALAGVSRERFLAATERVNVLSRFPGRRGSAAKGDAFDAAAARGRALRIRRRLAGRDVIVVGLATARALGVDARSLCRWTASGGGRVAVVPHPSGVNRWWNEPENRAMAARFLRSAIR